jgi:cytochrome c oxidase subunit 2
VPTEWAKLGLLVAIAVVLAIATFDMHTTEAPTVTTAAAPTGEVLFLTKGCSGCHTISGVSSIGVQGPDLTHLAAIAPERVTGLTAEEYVRQSLRQPQAFVVPEFRGTFVDMPTLSLSEQEIESLITLLLTER